MREGIHRTETFSDAVFAIAMTLLVLDLRLPAGGAGGRLWGELLALWPSYLAFALSFFILLITWMGHHDLMRFVRAENRRFHMANGLVLFFFTFVPFSTAVLASHLTGPDIKAAVTFYCGTFVMGSIAWNLLFAAIERGHLLVPDVDPRMVRFVRRSIRFGLLTTTTATLLALVLPWVALALSVVVRLNWLRVRVHPELQRAP